MKQFCLGVFAISIMCMLSLAQEPNAPSTGTQAPAQAPVQAPTQSPAQPAAHAGEPNQAFKIAPGSVIPVQLTRTVDAKKAKAGDQVEAKVVQDMKTNSGEVIVPKDTKVLGHVTEAQARNKEQKESEMRITFDRAMMKDGRDVSLPMSIQAIIAPRNPNSENASGGEVPSGGQAAGASSAPASDGRSARTGSPTGAAPQQEPGSSTGAGENSATAGGSNSAPQITGNTAGVIGFPDLTLSPTPQGANGSVITSEKKNVKLESGTLMLLKVDQASR